MAKSMTAIDQTLSEIFAYRHLSELSNDLSFILMYGPYMVMNSDLYATQIGFITSTQDTYGVILGLFEAVKKIIDAGSKKNATKAMINLNFADIVRDFGKQYPNSAHHATLSELVGRINEAATESAMTSYQPIVAYGAGLEKVELTEQYRNRGFEQASSLLSPVMMRFLYLELTDRFASLLLPQIAMDMFAAVPIQIMHHTELTYDVMMQSLFLTDANPLLRATLDMGSTDVFVQTYYFLAAASYLKYDDAVLTNFFRAYANADGGLTEEKSFMKRMQEIRQYTHVTESTELPEIDARALGDAPLLDESSNTAVYDEFTSYIYAHREVFCTQRANQKLLSSIPNLANNYAILQDDILIAKTTDEKSGRTIYVCPFEDLLTGRAIRYLVLGENGKISISDTMD